LKGRKDKRGAHLEQTPPKTAGIIIIGNEILTGKFQDINSYFLASELRSLGVNLMRISVIPDERDVIGKEAVSFSEDFDHVFTSGGIGPTHDDLTIEGIAAGFRVKIVRHTGLVERLSAIYKRELSEAILKMSAVPEGAVIISVGEKNFPVILFRNIYILPGIPQYLRNKFTAIRERFRSPSFHLKKFFLNAREPDIAGILTKVVSWNKEVAFGSYPVLDQQGYSVIITAESRSVESLGKAVDDLLNELPEGVLVRIE
jgi:FAD synthetase